MFLFEIKAFTEDGNWKQFAFITDELEEGLVAINCIARMNELVFEARLFDGLNWTELPAEAFDGSELLQPIMQLQQEWEQLLYSCKQ